MICFGNLVTRKRGNNNIEKMTEKKFQIIRTVFFITGLIILILVLFFKDFLPNFIASKIWLISGSLAIILTIIEIIKFRRYGKQN